MSDASRRAALDAAIELTHFAYRAMVAKPDALLAAVRAALDTREGR